MDRITGDSLYGKGSIAWRKAHYLLHNEAPIIWRDLVGCRSVYVERRCGIALSGCNLLTSARHFCRIRAAMNFFI